MKIAMMGTGYVGLTVGTCLAELGNNVTCVDIDEKKIEELKQGIIPIYEPGLSDLIKRNTKESRLFFTVNAPEAIKDAQVIFIAVGTPSDENNNADLKYVFQVAETIGKNMDSYKLIVDKSTVPVGTADKVAEKIRASQPNPIEFDVASNPEFLREGEAVNDFLHPDRIVVGTSTEKGKEFMEKIYKGIARTGKPMLFTDVHTAEMIKYAANAMLATRISFMNEVAGLCEKLDADVKMVARGMGLDTRIGPRFLQAGIGYGGSCFPKDVQAFVQTAQENGLDFKILQAVESANKEQKKSLLPKMKKFLPDLKGKKIALWGLAFKPKTDDMREAPAITIIEQLQAEGAIINAFDPEAQESAKKLFPSINYYQSMFDAIEGADMLVIVTEWNEFRNVDKQKIKGLLAQPNIVDGRNIYEPKEMKEAGFNYIGVGRN